MTDAEVRTMAKGTKPGAREGSTVSLGPPPPPEEESLAWCPWQAEWEGRSGPDFTSFARTLPDELLPKRNPASPGIVNSSSGLPKMREKHDLGTWPAAVRSLGPPGGGAPSWRTDAALRTVGGRPAGAGRDTKSTASWAAGPRDPQRPGEPEARAAPTASPAPRRQHFPELSEARGARGEPGPGQRSPERRPREPLG
uniref:Uncharacterized protein n=1 Tax=Rangifer tarandus platyrhynchus TaxID=3082113 RepID=A0ACB0DWS4_RANTA|nr:unnamed protein product [Rangifer tarandus platyrhynchus]